MATRMKNLKTAAVVTFERSFMLPPAGPFCDLDKVCCAQTGLSVGGAVDMPKIKLFILFYLDRNGEATCNDLLQQEVSTLKRNV